jgi:ribosomal protein S18 acetylase RimI-like enzyme
VTEGHIRIIRSDPSHLPAFDALWQQAAVFQARIGAPAWTAFPGAIIAADMAEARHFMGERTDGVCAGFFSMVWRDEAIWQERDRDDAVYIHRMCGNPETRGDRFAAHVFAWALRFARATDRACVRMDTWAENARLIAYYERCGFVRVGTRTIGDEPRLPPHYQGISLALFENPVNGAPSHE